MRKLEENVLQRRLFEREGRQVRLTAEGQILLGFARRILKLHGEVMTTLREPHMVGTVRIGTPDDYVMRFIPGILAASPRPIRWCRWTSIARPPPACCNARTWT